VILAAVIRAVVVLAAVIQAVAILAAVILAVVIQTVVIRTFDYVLKWTQKTLVSGGALALNIVVSFNIRNLFFFLFRNLARRSFGQ
jgi:hypothetical protein